MPIINKLPQGGSGKSKLNIFTQMNEPETKEGIWLKKNGTFNKINIDGNPYVSNEWDEFLTYTNLPSRRYSKYSNCFTHFPGSPYIFAFGYNSNQTSSDRCIKLTLPSLSSVDIANLPNRGSAAHVPCAISLSKIIIIPGSADYTKGIYMYDVDFNTYTLVSSNNIIYMTAIGASSVFVPEMNCIFVYGLHNLSSGSTQYGENLIKININNYGITNIKCPVTTGKIARVGDYIYIFSSKATSYKYDINNNIFSILSELSILPSGGPISVCNIGTDIFIIWDDYKTYKFDTLTSICTLEDDSKYYGGILLYTPSIKKIYKIGGGLSSADNNREYNETFSVISKQYDNNSVVIQKEGMLAKYYTELMSSDKIEGDNSRLTTGFNDAFYCDDEGVLSTTPLAYGNGNKWITIRN